MKKILMICLVMLLTTAEWGSSLPVLADEDLNRLMGLSLEDLLEVTVVSAARHEQKMIDSPRMISVITSEDIRKNNYRTTPEALSDLTGILVQETNYGGGSPIIRGLMGNQVLILIDGIRLNNAIFRLGPNQYLNTIDINQIERIEVVRGTGSVLYGSDALGGVINIITKTRSTPEGIVDANRIDGRLFSRLSSADLGRTGHAEFGGNLDRTGFTGGISYKKFDDLHGGNGTGLQTYTGYDEWDADLKLHHRFSGRQNLVIGIQHVNQSNVPRTDVLSSGSDLKREWDPQRRDLVYARYSIKRFRSFFDEIQVGLSYHVQSEDLFRITSSNPGVEREYHDEVNTLGLTTQFQSRISDIQHLTYGMEYYNDDVNSGRVDVDLDSGGRTEKEGTFADGSLYNSFATFIQDEVRVTEPLSMIVGLRYNWFHLEANVEDPEVGIIMVNSNPKSFTSSAYALYKLTDNVSLNAGVAQGFRAPNVDDATILGSFGSGFEVPNPDLDPETSLNFEIGLKAQHNRFSGSLYYTHSHFKDFIERQLGTFNGMSFLDTNGNGIQDEGEEAVYQRMNTGKAQIRGIEAEGSFLVSSKWRAFGYISWFRGSDLEDGFPLRRIPPVMGNLGLTWIPARKWSIEYYNKFATKQDRLSSEDIDDPRIPEGGTPGFITYNLRARIDLSSIGRLTVGAENLSNEAYRLHSSGIDSPGFNFVIGYEFPI